MALQIKKDFSLRELNSLNIECIAKYFVNINNEEELAELFNNSIFHEEKIFILGGGCNILFTTTYFDRLVIKVNLTGINVLEETEDSVIVESGAGENWHDLVTFCVDKNYGGIENMALIPGLVGAAPIGNIAAYGQNFSDVLLEVITFDLTDGTQRVFSKEECEFTYRESAFKHKYDNRYLISKVRIRLDKKSDVNLEYWSTKYGSVAEEVARIATAPYTIKDLYNAVINLRVRKFPDPKVYGTAGSFFKNPTVSKEQLAQLLLKVPKLQYYPIEKLHYVENVAIDRLEDEFVKVAAGQLIDEVLGLKGYWKGDVGLHEKHALVLATRNTPKAEDVYEFAKWVQQKFYDEFGFELENEVRFVS